MNIDEDWDIDVELTQYIEVGPVKVDTGDNYTDFAFVAFFIILLFVIQIIWWYIKGKK